MKITAKDFGLAVAKAMNKIGSSHVFFIIQQAFPDQDLLWSDVQDMLDAVIAQERPGVRHELRCCQAP